MECPGCGVSISFRARKCECGHDFVSAGGIPDSPIQKALWFLVSLHGRIGRTDLWFKWMVPNYAILFLLLLNDVSTLIWVFLLVALWPSIAVLAKRWHDRDKSGWWNLISLVPGVGPLWLVIECGFVRGTAGPNRFGPDPVGKA